MGTARGVRAETNSLLAKERKRAEEEIARLTNEHSARLKRLEEENKRQLESQKRELAEIKRQLTAAVASSQKEIEQKLLRDREEAQRKLALLEKEARMKVEALKNSFERELKRLYEEIDQRIRELHAQLEEMRASERDSARQEIEHAKAAYDATSRDIAVQTFEGETLSALLPPLVNSSVEKYNAGNMASAISMAMMAALECRRCQLEAENKREDWLKSLNAAKQQLGALLHSLSQLDQPTQVEALGLPWRGKLRWHLESGFTELWQRLNELAQALDELRPGDVGGLAVLNSSINSIKENEVLESLIKKLHLHVLIFLMEYKLLCALLQAAQEEDAEWERMEGSLQMDHAHCTGAMVLVNGDEDRITANVSMDAGAFANDQILLILNVAISGYRDDKKLQRALEPILNALTLLVQEDECGNLTRDDAMQTYKTADGATARRLQFRVNGDLLPRVTGLIESAVETPKDESAKSEPKQNTKPHAERRST